jgi:hypothetical protein
MVKNKTFNLGTTIKNLSSGPWVLGNSVLYKLCKDHPLHKTDEEITAKIWLIGRAYAASVERRKNKNNINDDFYSEVVIPQIKKSSIDKWIRNCKSEKTKEVCLSAHKKTTDLFKNISGLEKRSLASKYLHFHLPDLFFLYDSRASNGINVLFRELGIGKIRIRVAENNFDKSYTLFYNKCLRAQSEIRKQYGILLSCRQLDTLLINIANQSLRK